MDMKHDEYVQRLASSLQERYDSVIIDHEIRDKKRAIAQADLIGIKDGQVDVYEVKCSYRIHKAGKQLKRLKRLMHAAHTYFYCGSSGSLEEIMT
jgi:hypothetical protein